MSRLPKGWPADSAVKYLPKSEFSKAATQLLQAPPASFARIPRGDFKPVTPGHVAIRAINDKDHPANGQHGLFANASFKEGDWVVDYKGLVTLDEECSQTSDYSLSLAQGLSIDADKYGNEARFVNDYRGVPNATKPTVEFRIEMLPNGLPQMRLYVRPKTKIKRGDELLVSYGKGFWLARTGNGTWQACAAFLSIKCSGGELFRPSWLNNGDMSRLRAALLLVRDLEATHRFLEQGLRLPVLAKMDSQIIYGDVDGLGADIIVQSVEMGTEAPLSVGYSPFLNFQVQDFDETLYRLVEHGARMDGAVKYNPSGKTATFRAPDGFMLGIFEEE